MDEGGRRFGGHCAVCSWRERAMPVFNYIGKTRSGTVQKGEIEANDRKTEAAVLRQRQVLVTSIRPRQKIIALKMPGFGGKVKEKDIVIFTRQLATMIDAGL